ncbi:flavoprotein [Streptomyces sp. NBC_01527]|uniref:flavoprotein n=1 Tax=Streptomyces sp. NBC_01527 TaxID=2903894 RepID=UPI003869FC6A
MTLTQNAGRWLRANGELDRLEQLTGLPVRDTPRLPTEARPHPVADCYVVAPASANYVAKLATGIADSQALTQVSAGHRRHPSSGVSSDQRGACTTSGLGWTHRNSAESRRGAGLWSQRLATGRTASGPRRSRASLECDLGVRTTGIGKLGRLAPT